MLPPDDRLAIPVAEAAKLLSISRAAAYSAIARGLMPAVRIGGCIRVPRQVLIEWIERVTTGPTQTRRDDTLPVQNEHAAVQEPCARFPRSPKSAAMRMRGEPKAERSDARS